MAIEAAINMTKHPSGRPNLLPTERGAPRMSNLTYIKARLILITHGFNPQVKKGVGQNNTRTHTYTQNINNSPLLN